MKVIYVAGNGHSGSTLLDMILGDCEGYFSAGELTHITRKSIFDEYCSCGKIIKECPVWKEIVACWSLSSPVSIEMFRILRHRYERNKTLPRLLVNLVRPSKEFLLYCEANKVLLDAIQSVTGASVIVDSSKSATRIPILKRIADVRVIHICRNFTGVMNSVNQFRPKNLKKGIEEDLQPLSSRRAFVIWLLNNMLVLLLGSKTEQYRISYRQLVSDPDKSLGRFDSKYSGLKAKTFSPEHMLAGNVIRLRRNLKLDSNLGFSYRNLSKKQLRLGMLVDRVFYFWS